MADEAKSRLGRGLAALIGDVGDESAALERTRSQRRVPIEFVKPNPRNPRRHFADVELDEQSGEELPDREAMSLINANVAAPINAAVALNALSDHSTAIANAQQANDITQGNR